MRRWIYGAVAVVALVGAWWIGRSGYTPTATTLASALQQEPTPSAAPGGENDKAAYLTTFLDHLASNLNVDRAILDQAIRDAGNHTLDQAVADDRLTEQQAERLRERIADFPNNLDHVGGWGGPHGRFGGRGGGHGFGPMSGGPSELMDNLNAVVDAVAARLNLDADDLRTQLQDGRSLLEIAEAQGVSEEDLRATIEDAVQTQLDAAVADGELTQQQADRIQQHIESIPLDRSWFGGRRWMR